jgi:hypothetical protein
MSITGTHHGSGPHAAVVWVDGWHALVARSDDGRRTITEIDREAGPELDYLLRVARETSDCDRLMILGSGEARLAFEREYVTLYRRPDRLVDVEAAAATTPTDLIDRLRFLDALVRPTGH